MDSAPGRCATCSVRQGAPALTHLRARRGDTAIEKDGHPSPTSSTRTSWGFFPQSLGAAQRRGDPHLRASRRRRPRRGARQAPQRLTREHHGLRARPGGSYDFAAWPREALERRPYLPGRRSGAASCAARDASCFRRNAAGGSCAASRGRRSAAAVDDTSATRYVRTTSRKGTRASGRGAVSAARTSRPRCTSGTAPTSTTS